MVCSESKDGTVNMCWASVAMACNSFGSALPIPIAMTWERSRKQSSKTTTKTPPQTTTKEKKTTKQIQFKSRLKNIKDKPRTHISTYKQTTVYVHVCCLAKSFLYCLGNLSCPVRIFLPYGFTLCCLGISKRLQLSIYVLIGCEASFDIYYLFICWRYVYLCLHFCDFKCNSY